MDGLRFAPSGSRRRFRRGGPARSRRPADPAAPAGLRGAAVSGGEPRPPRHQGRADGGGLGRDRRHRRQPGAVRPRHPPGDRRRGPRRAPDRAAPRLPAGHAGRRRRRPRRRRRRRPAPRGAALAVALAARGGLVAAAGAGDGGRRSTAPPIVAVVPIVDVAGDAASRELAGRVRQALQHRGLARFREFQMVGARRRPSSTATSRPTGSRSTTCSAALCIVTATACASRRSSPTRAPATSSGRTAGTGRPGSPRHAGRGHRSRS